jgi:hypothetical protein
MIIISGQTYSTIADAVRELAVSAKTIRQYIAKKIIPEPPVIQFGNRTVKRFSQNYLTAAKKAASKIQDRKRPQGIARTSAGLRNGMAMGGEDKAGRRTGYAQQINEAKDRKIMCGF